MTELEINKIIIEYLGVDHPIPVNLSEMSEKQLSVFLPFTNSLDALVPVWNKLALRGIWVNLKRHGVDNYDIVICEQNESWSTDCAGDTNVFMTAAIATVKAIQECTRSSNEANK